MGHQAKINRAENYLNSCTENNEVMTKKFFIYLTPQKGSGPIPEVLQYWANPWGSRSKLLHLPRVPKISLISKSPSGGRIRY